MTNETMMLAKPVAMFTRIPLLITPSSKNAGGTHPASPQMAPATTALHTSKVPPLTRAAKNDVAILVILLF